MSGRGTLYVVVNGRIVKAFDAPKGAAMDVEYNEHKNGRTRWTRRALTSAEYLGTIPHRLARHVGRRSPHAA